MLLGNCGCRRVVTLPAVSFPVCCCWLVSVLLDRRCPPVARMHERLVARTGLCARPERGGPHRLGGVINYTTAVKAVDKSRLHRKSFHVFCRLDVIPELLIVHR